MGVETCHFIQSKFVQAQAAKHWGLREQVSIMIAWWRLTKLPVKLSD
jgi:hypothetical protein